jgi:putative lipoprotein
VAAQTIYKLKRFRGVVAVLLLVVIAGCAHQSKKEDPWFGKDKLYHFVASGVIGAGVTELAQRNGVHECTAPVIGVSVTLGIGAGKEMYDKYHKGTFYSWKDMMWDLAGGTFGSVLVADCD